MSNERSLLVAPGPVEIAKQSLEAFGKNPVHHRSPEFTDCLVNSQKLLKEVLKTDYHCLAISASGSGAMEAAVVNFVSPGEKTLVVVSGKFGQRWADMLQIYGMEVDVIHIPWGKSVSLEQIKAALENKKYSAVYTQMCETSTGALHPVEEIGSWLKTNHPDCLFIVDGITGLLTTELNLEASGIDVIICGSQKAFMMPTGMAFVVLNEKAKLRCDKAECPRYYFDLRKEIKALAKNQTAFSTAVNHYYALEETLKLILDKGLDSHYNEIKWRSDLCHKMLEICGLKSLAENPAPVLTAILLPDGMNGKALRSRIEKERRFTFMGGQDDFEGKIIRIGHIGAMEKQDYVDALMAFVEEFGKESEKDTGKIDQWKQELQKNV